MILINVLIIVMLATAILSVMIVGDDTDVELAIRMNNAAQARAVAAGGEASAIVALRRDLKVGNDSDSYLDDWAAIQDDDAAIDGGRFTFTVADAQARFNINNLIRGDTLNRGHFAAILAAVGLPAERVAPIVELVQSRQGIANMTDLTEAGLSLAELRQLAELATVLPEPTAVNLNTAPETLAAIVLNNPGKARVLLAERDVPRRSGGTGASNGLTREDMVALNIFPPQGTSVTSNYFWTRGLVTIGGDRQQLTSLLYRRSRDGGPQVLVLKRWRGLAPLEAPDPSL
ncbi:MAG: Type II secretory pathway component PulK-like protein [Pontixanthobacter sp.]